MILMKVLLAVTLTIGLFGQVGPVGRGLADSGDAAGLCAIGIGSELMEIKVIDDPDGLARRIDMPRSARVRVAEVLCAPYASISIFGCTPWIDVAGPLTSADPSFFATGIGTVAGVSGVTAAFDGIRYGFSRHGERWSGVGGFYAIGTNGELGGAPVVYEVARKPGTRTSAIGDPSLWPMC